MTTHASDALTPEWLAHRYEPAQDAIHYLRVDRATRRRVPFLTDANLQGLEPPLVVRRDGVDVPPEAAAPAHFIFHSAYCCSTLVANAYDRPGTAFPLKEPLLLNDLVGWRHRGAGVEKVRPVLKDAVKLLARPFIQGEACIIKPSNVVNGLASAMMDEIPTAHALLLYAPLDVFVASIASKGLFGRLWVRDLIDKQLRDGLAQLGYSREDYFLQTDLQIAAAGWLAQQALFGAMARKYPDRIRTLNSEILTARPAESLAALDAHFGIEATGAQREAIVAEVFSRNAKSGEAFSRQDREAGQQASVSAHRDEIDKVLAWAEILAEHNGIAIDPGNPLIA